MHLRITQERGGRADVAQPRVDARLLQNADALGKPPVLQGGAFGVGGVGEVGEHALHPEGGQRLQQGGGLRRLLR